MQNSGKIQTWFLNTENPRGHHLWGFLFLLKLLTSFFKDIISYAFSNRSMCFTQYSYFPLITAREITIFWTSEVPS